VPIVETVTVSRNGAKNAESLVSPPVERLAPPVGICNAHLNRWHHGSNFSGRITLSVRLTMKAYLFINVRAGKAAEVMESVQRATGVRRADLCWGRPDIIAVVDVPDEDALGKMVLGEVQPIEGVESTDTHLAFE
jgi:DNA-binding Lrp family transcriptional regulator